MNNQTKIAELLSQSDLSAEQADELLMLFGRSEDIELLPVVEILTQDISWAKKIHQNYLAKKDALKNSDDKKWQAIFQKEKEELQNLN